MCCLGRNLLKCQRWEYVLQNLIHMTTNTDVSHVPDCSQNLKFRFFIHSFFFARVGNRAPSSTMNGAFRIAMSGICPRQITCGTAIANRRYRTANGVCNNLYRPLQGSQLTPQPRLLFAVYEDGKWTLPSFVKQAHINFTSQNITLPSNRSGLKSFIY